MKLAVTLQVLLLVVFHSASAQRAHSIAQPVKPEPGVLTTDVPQLVIRGIEKDMNTRGLGPPEQFIFNTTPQATFDVTYIGFPSDAQTAFQAAVDIWASIITSSVTIRVTARWTSLAPGVLGSASAQSLSRDFSGAPIPGTWYPIALAEKLACGVDLNSVDSADIKATFNSTQSNWYLGTDGNPPPGQYDLVSVVLHELGHGLGFFGSMNVTSGSGSWGGGTGFPFIFDLFAENGSNQQLINTTLFPNPSVALGTQLTSNNIFFDGPNATPANGGTPPKLYCPATWTPGSSFSHLDETAFPAGSPNSLMTPMLGTAEAIHSPGDVSLGMFDDWGWTTVAPPPSEIKWEEIFGGTTPPPGWHVVDNDGSGTFMDFIQGLLIPPDTLFAEAGLSFWWSTFSNANSNGLIDEWLISPKVQDIENGDSLYFWAGAVDQGFDDSLKVKISTTDSALGSFAQIAYFKVDGPFPTWHEYGFDLSQFAGDDIFIVVDYYVVDGGPSGNSSDNVWIDHFLITTDNPSSVGNEDLEIPKNYLLAENYPNPFNPETRIRFELPASGNIRLEVYNILGQHTATLYDGFATAGTHEVSFDAKNLSSGVYYYTMTAGSAVLTRKMLLMR